MFETYTLKDFLFHFFKKWKLSLAIFLVVIIGEFSILKLPSQPSSYQQFIINSAYTFKSVESNEIYTNDGYQRSSGNTIKTNYDLIKSEIFVDLIANELGSQYLEAKLPKGTDELAKLVTVKDTSSTELLIVEVKTNDQEFSKNLAEAVKTVISKNEINSQYNIITAGVSEKVEINSNGGFRTIYYPMIVFLGLFISGFVIFAMTFFFPTVNYQNLVLFNNFGSLKNLTKTKGNINYYCQTNAIDKIAIVGIDKNTNLSVLQLNEITTNIYDDYKNDESILESLTSDSSDIVLVVTLGKTQYQTLASLVSDLENRNLNIIGIVYN